MEENNDCTEKSWFIRIYEGLDGYWSRQSAWIPIMIIAFGMFSTAMRPGAMNLYFGRDVDMTKRVAVFGQFQSHSWKNTSYELAASGGGKLHLACYPRAPLNDCLKEVPIDDGPLSVVYAPLRPGWPHLIDGVILQVQSGPRILVSEADSLRRLTPKPMTIHILIVNIIVYSLISAAVGILTIILGIGMLNTLRRITGKFKHEQ